MSTGLWVLVILAAAGLLLIVAGVIPALLAMRRVLSHADEIQHSRLMVSLDALQRESLRFTALRKRVQPLQKRASNAIEQIRGEAGQLREVPGGDALAQAGAEIRALTEDLR